MQLLRSVVIELAVAAVIVLVLLALLGHIWGSPTDRTVLVSVGEGELVAVMRRVVDGDTYRVTIDGQDEQTVRLIGADTPETQLVTDPEPFGEQATARAMDLLPVGSWLLLVPGVDERDRYGRLLADVYASDGRSVAEVLVSEGLAEHKSYGRNRRLDDVLSAAELRARAAGVGVWSVGRA